MNRYDMREKYGYVPDLIDSPMEALDWHLRYFEWMGSDAHLRTMHDFMDVYFQKRDKIRILDTHTGDTLSREPVPHDTRMLASQEANVVNRGVTTWVAEDVCEFIEQASENMPNGILQVNDTPAPMGLLIFARPLDYMDTSGTVPEEITGFEPLPLRAISWEETIVGHGDGTTHPGVRFYIYTDTEYMESYRAKFGDPALCSVLGSLPRLMLIDMTAWSYGSEWTGEIGRTVTDFENHILADHMARLRRFILCLWTFMAQEVVGISGARPPRPAQRRADRSGKEMPDDGCIKVIHLRKPKRTKRADDDERAEVEWSHRWWVSGHWRQVLGKEGPRLVWVRPHIKGPDSKPLIIKERIIAVDR